ncbi:MAG: RtcB family protein [Myxococcales bacterium]|nr:RtcB family protein [Myxococcales bacterium]
MTASIRTWVADPLHPEVRQALERLARAPDVVRLAVMPDVHLAHGVCIGTVTATRRRIYPAAVGGDIGCGVAVVRLGVAASAVDDREAAASILSGLYQRVPFIKHAAGASPDLPAHLPTDGLSSPALGTLARRDGRLQLGTLGRGNHFLELQRDQAGELWLAVHSGSRAMGPAIREHYMRQAEGSGALASLDCESPAGAAYLADVQWARSYAATSRRRMVEQVAALAEELFDARVDWDSFFDCDHNHVAREPHAGEPLWVHRKGALHAADGELGIIPGSMGSPSYHVAGRGLPDALCSSSHGAGRAMSRSEARRRISRTQLLGDIEGVWFDHRLTQRLREEAPAAYKDIGKVMRAQRELTRVVRRLEPVLVHKGA